MKIFWTCFHSIMFIVLAAICMFTEIASAGKEIRNSEKHSNDKKEYYIGETIMIMLIILAVGITVLIIVLNIVMKNQTAAVWVFGVSGTVYVYIAVKQTIKMIFVSEKRAFSFSDIKDFIYTYMVWWIMVIAVSSIELGNGKLNKLTSTYGEVVEVGLLLFWYYFNILYALGGLYILLYYLGKVVKSVATKFGFRGEKIENIVNRIYDLWQRGEKYTGLKSFRLWKRDNGTSVVYRIFMTIPLLMFDICRVIYLFAKYSFRMMFVFAVVLIFDPIRILHKFAKNLWYRHKNNEWIYLFAQIAGLFSYVIVFLIIQYSEYEEVTKNVYEFAGTIILVPYFISKIVNVNKNPKDDDVKVNIEGEKEEAVPKNMVYNEIGEGAIDEKTN